MTKKKRRRRRPSGGRREQAPAGRASRQAAGEAEAADAAEERRSRPSTTKPSARGRASGSGEGRAAPQPIQPPLLPSLGRGIVVVGRSPAMLVTTFVGVVLLWLTYASSGQVRVASPGTMTQLVSLPPMHSLLDTSFVLVGMRVFPPALTLGLALALLVLRAALASYWVALSLETLRGERDWRTAARASAAPALRSVQAMVAVEAMFLALVFVLPQVLAAVLSSFGSVLALLGGMYFFAYVPVVVVAERVGLRDSLRLAIRMARARGPQHILLVFPYMMAALFLVTYGFGGLAAPATPSFATWVLTLAVSFVHVAVLAALADRWLRARRDVIDSLAAGPARPRRQTARAGIR